MPIPPHDGGGRRPHAVASMPDSLPRRANDGSLASASDLSQNGRSRLLDASPSVMYWLQVCRQTTAAVAVTALVSAGLVGSGAVSDGLAILAFGTLVIASTSGFIQIGLRGRIRDADRPAHRAAT